MRKVIGTSSVLLVALALSACAHQAPTPQASQMARQQDATMLAAPGEQGALARARRASQWSRSGGMTRQELGADYTGAGTGAVPTRRNARAAAADANGGVR